MNFLISYLHELLLATNINIINFIAIIKKLIYLPDIVLASAHNSTNLILYIYIYIFWVVLGEFNIEWNYFMHVWKS